MKKIDQTTWRADLDQQRREWEPTEGAQRFRAKKQEAFKERQEAHYKKMEIELELEEDRQIDCEAEERAVIWLEEQAAKKKKVATPLKGSHRGGRRCQHCGNGMRKTGNHGRRYD